MRLSHIKVEYPEPARGYSLSFTVRGQDIRVIFYPSLRMRWKIGIVEPSGWHMCFWGRGRSFIQALDKALMKYYRQRYLHEELEAFKDRHAEKLARIEEGLPEATEKAFQKIQERWRQENSAHYHQPE